LEEGNPLSPRKPAAARTTAAKKRKREEILLKEGRGKGGEKKCASLDRSHLWQWRGEGKGKMALSVLAYFVESRFQPKGGGEEISEEGEKGGGGRKRKRDWTIAIPRVV